MAAHAGHPAAAADATLAGGQTAFKSSMGSKYDGSAAPPFESCGPTRYQWDLEAAADAGAAAEAGPAEAAAPASCIATSDYRFVYLGPKVRAVRQGQIVEFWLLRPQLS